MSTSLIQVELPPKEPPIALTQAQALLRQMVLDALPSVHSKRTTQKRLIICFPSVPGDLSPALCSRNIEPRWITSLHQLSTSACRRYESWSAKRDATA